MAHRAFLPPVQVDRLPEAERLALMYEDEWLESAYEDRLGGMVMEDSWQADTLDDEPFLRAIRLTTAAIQMDEDESDMSDI